MGRPSLLSLQELTWEMTMTGDTQPTRVQRATPINRLPLILVAVLFGCSLVASIGIFGWAVFGGGNLFSRKVTSEDLEAIAIQDGDLGANIALSVIWESVDDLKRFQGTISPDALFRRQVVNGNLVGEVVLLWFGSEADAFQAHAKIEQNIVYEDTSADRRGLESDVGESRFAMVESYAGFNAQWYTTVATRCGVVFYLSLPNTNIHSALNYAIRLDERIQNTLC